MNNFSITKIIHRSGFARRHLFGVLQNQSEHGAVEQQVFLPVILLILTLVYLFLYNSSYLVTSIPRWRQAAASEGGQASSTSEPHPHLSITSCTTSPTEQSIPERKQKISITKLGYWKGIEGLEIRFGKDGDFVDGFTSKIDSSRLQLLNRMFRHRPDLEYAVNLNLNLPASHLEVKETLSVLGRPETPPRIVVSRTVWVHLDSFTVLRADNKDGEEASAHFTILLALKTGVKFKTATVKMDGGAPEQANALFLKAFEDKIMHMRYLEVRISEYQKKDATGKLLFDADKLLKALEVHNTESKFIQKGNIQHENPQSGCTQQKKIRVQFPSHTVGRSTNNQGTVGMTPEVATPSSTTPSSPSSPTAQTINLISGYIQPPLKISKPIVYCAAGADLGAGFDSLTVDDKLILLDKKLRDVAIQDRLGNALTWIEEYERAIELAESGGVTGKGYVGEQTYMLGQLGCPYSIVDLLYMMALCRLEKRREITMVYEESSRS